MASELERAARELYEHASRHTTRGGHEVGVISIEGLVVLRFMESVEDLATPQQEPEGIEIEQVRELLRQAVKREEELLEENERLRTKTVELLEENERLRRSAIANLNMLLRSDDPEYPA